jgi:hypothetical protein
MAQNWRLVQDLRNSPGVSRRLPDLTLIKVLIDPLWFNRPRASLSELGVGFAMRKGVVLAIAIAVTLSASLAARSDEIPTLDVRPVCHGIASQSGDPADVGLQTTFEQCVQSEQDVREQLKKAWSSFSAADKQHCVTLAKTGGESSNTELLTCLEMARDVRVIRSSATTSQTADTAGNQSVKSGRSTTRAPSPPPTVQPTPPADKSSKTEADSMMRELNQAKADAKQARTDAQDARISEQMTRGDLADAEGELKQTKEEAARATKEAERSKEDAQAARKSRADAESKLAIAEAGRVAAEGREQACQSAAKSQPGLGGWLRRLFGHESSSPENP